MSNPNSPRKIRVLLADDHIVVRMGIASLISCEKDVSVVGEADDGEEAVRLAATLNPDVIIMDLMMPKLSGLEATREILTANPTTKILILTSFGTSSEIAQVLRAGALGALLKSSSREELIAGIRSVHAGVRAVSPEIENSISSTELEPTLSERQMEVLNLASRGFTNHDIGKILGISVNSVKDHLKAIYARLNVANRTEAIAIALREHLLKI